MIRETPGGEGRGVARAGPGVYVGGVTTADHPLEIIIAADAHEDARLGAYAPLGDRPSVLQGPPAHL